MESAASFFESFNPLSEEAIGMALSQFELGLLGDDWDFPSNQLGEYPSPSLLPCDNVNCLTTPISESERESVCVVHEGEAGQNLPDSIIPADNCATLNYAELTCVAPEGLSSLLEGSIVQHPVTPLPSLPSSSPISPLSPPPEANQVRTPAKEKELEQGGENSEQRGEELEHRGEVLVQQCEASNVLKKWPYAVKSIEACLKTPEKTPEKINKKKRGRLQLKCDVTKNQNKKSSPPTKKRGKPQTAMKDSLRRRYDYFAKSNHVFYTAHTRIADAISVGKKICVYMNVLDKIMSSNIYPQLQITDEDQEEICEIKNLIEKMAKIKEAKPLSIQSSEFLKIIQVYLYSSPCSVKTTKVALTREEVKRLQFDLIRIHGNLIFLLHSHSKEMWENALTVNAKQYIYRAKGSGEDTTSLPYKPYGNADFFKLIKPTQFDMLLESDRNLFNQNHHLPVIRESDVNSEFMENEI